MYELLLILIMPVYGPFNIFVLIVLKFLTQYSCPVVFLYLVPPLTCPHTYPCPSPAPSLDTYPVPTPGLSLLLTSDLSLPLTCVSPLTF